MRLPTVSIIIVNYNGRHLLEKCLDSVQDTKYPSKKIEIIVVDNNSRDDSVFYIKKHYPDVKLIESTENLGFTGGNNLGLAHSSGEMIALLNSDTRVTPNWLIELVKAIEPKIVGIASPKIYFDIPFIELTIKSKIISRTDLDNSADFSPLGVLMEKVRCENDELTNLVWYQSGFNKERGEDIATRWTTGDATILLPVNVTKTTNTYDLTFHGYPKAGAINNKIEILLGDKIIHVETIKPNQVKQIALTIDKKEIKNKLKFLIQNSGNVVLGDGRGKDRGSILRIKDKKVWEFYDLDHPYYDKPAELLAFCGAACLIKKTLIDKIGFFDGHYFMYYEDMDFSLRTWKNGWNIAYTPKSVIFHKHKATTGTTNSGFFLGLVERNHLSFVLTHFPLKTFFIQLVIFFVRTLVSIFYAFAYRFSSNLDVAHDWEVKADSRKETVQYMLKHWPRILKNRFFWGSRQVRNFEQMKKHLY